MSTTEFAGNPTFRQLRVDDQPGLTKREWEVAMTIAGGVSNRAAGQTLFLSEKTIEMYLTRIYRKLGIRSRCQLAVWFADQDHWLEAGM